MAALLTTFMNTISGYKADLPICMAIGSKLGFWQSNHHTRTVGHRVSEEELEGVVAKLYSVIGSQVGNPRALLDCMWLCGHLFSTHMVLAHAYGPGTRVDANAVVDWTRAIWGADCLARSADFMRRLRTQPAGTAQLQLACDFHAAFTFFNGLKMVALPKQVCIDFTKALVCMARGHQNHERMHTGSAYLTGNPPLFTDQQMSEQTTEVIVSAIHSLGMKASYSKTQPFRDNWSRELGDSIWVKIFKGVVDIHFKVLQSGIDGHDHIIPERTS